MKIWRISSVALAIAVAFPLPAAAQSNAELLKELKALRDRVTQLENKLKAAEEPKPAPAAPVAAAPAAPAIVGMTPDQAREMGRIAVKVDALEDERENSFLKGLEIHGSIDPAFIYNRAQDTAGFQFLQKAGGDDNNMYAYDNSFFGTATLDIVKQLEGGSIFRLTLMPNRGVGSFINDGDIVHEASASIPLTDENTRLIAGQIPDWSGYELLPSAENKLITHNLLFDFIAPLAYTGAGLELTRGDWVVKGVIGNMNATKQSTGDKSPVVAYRADYSISEFSGIGFSGVHGKAFNIVYDEAGITGNTGLNLFEVDGYFIRGDWTLQGQASYGRQSNAAIALSEDGDYQDAQWWGVSALAAYKFTPRLEGVVRADYIDNHKNGGGLLGYSFDDAINGIGRGVLADGSFAKGDAVGANRYAISAGMSYRVDENATLKVEYRLDGSNQPVFGNPDATRFSKTNHLLGASVVVSF
jgi:opacity protein-like surface antigen